MDVRYTYTRLLVENCPDCFRFYRDVLGFDPGVGDESSSYPISLPAVPCSPSSTAARGCRRLARAARRLEICLRYSSRSAHDGMWQRVTGDRIW
jgi:hypothetical protein